MIWEILNVPSESSAKRQMKGRFFILTMQTPDTNEMHHVPEFETFTTTRLADVIDENTAIIHPHDPSGRGIPVQEWAYTHAAPWAYTVLDGIETFKQNQRARDKATKQIAQGLVEMTGDTYGLELDTKRSKGLLNVFLGIDQQSSRQNMRAPKAFSAAVYAEMVPTLLGVNGVSEVSENAAGYNGVSEVVTASLQLLKAASVRQHGGKFRIFSQMCAHYASGDTHEAASFTKGLAPELNPDKVAQVAAPLRGITHALQRFGIPVEVVTPQLVADPKVMFAMVPATVWGYLEQGKITQMLRHLNRHASEFPPMLQNQLMNGYDTPLVHRAPSLTEPIHSDTSIMDHTLALLETFERIYNLYEGTGETRWHELTVTDLKRFRSYIDRSSNYETLVARAQAYSIDAQNLLPVLLPPLFRENWGALDDTESFYRREQERRAGMKAGEWLRRADRANELQGLLGDSDFYPEELEERRIQRAEELLSATEQLANIGIGGRAIFNVALYASLGRELAHMNHGPNRAIMYPLEEDRDRWAIDTMARSYAAHLPQETGGLPCVYPGKHLRQPFI
ncbi:hypothetical protein HY469_02395 [Candidatus Roizmanbacteria bacterium]|nr:hypothetical protein [Candidatus Roizmanbacteria bacterium]